MVKRELKVCLVYHLREVSSLLVDCTMSRRQPVAALDVVIMRWRNIMMMDTPGQTGTKSTR